jgi:predicted O-methyltransferase YrrM
MDVRQPVLERICATGRVEGREGNQLEAFPLGIWPEEGQVLYDLARRPDVATTIEVGMAYGVSTLFICQALRDKGGGHHTAIDPEQHSTWDSIGLLNLERAGLRDLVTLHATPDYVALPQLLQRQERYDLAFVDGMHAFDYVLLDFFYLDRMLRPGGYLVFDDLWMPAVRKAICFVLRNRSYELAPDLFGERASLRTQLGRLLRDVPPVVRRSIVLQNPCNRFYLGVVGQHGVFNYVVLRKRSDDDRIWHHFRTF